MTEQVRYRCKNCGHRFEAEVLTEQECREAKRRDQPVSPVQCPQCRRTDIERGWE